MTLIQSCKKSRDASLVRQENAHLHLHFFQNLTFESTVFPRRRPALVILTSEVSGCLFFLTHNGTHAVSVAGGNPTEVNPSYTCQLVLRCSLHFLKQLSMNPEVVTRWLKTMTNPLHRKPRGHIVTAHVANNVTFPQLVLGHVNN